MTIYIIIVLLKLLLSILPNEYETPTVGGLVRIISFLFCTITFLFVLYDFVSFVLYDLRMSYDGVLWEFVFDLALEFGGVCRVCVD
jgi:hypothetical protein